VASFKASLPADQDSRQDEQLSDLRLIHYPEGHFTAAAFQFD
jgi:hypothetical protein